jgi:gamma-butyrobetaine dioxygenase
VRIASTDVIEEGAAIRIEWIDGASSRFHAVWLRDNAQDPKTRSPENGQRLITLAAVPPDTRIVRAVHRSTEVEISFAPDDTTVSFEAAFLNKFAYDKPPRHEPGRVDDHLELWDRRLSPSAPRAAFTEVRRDRKALGAWLSQVRRLGFSLLEGCPVENGAIAGVVDLFGYIRQTNYGRWFDVRSQINPANLAYTGLALQAHTDNPYRDPVPTLQLLYCLENSAEGGESILVDGFLAARRLLDEDPSGFDLLSGHRAAFEYAGTPGVRLRARRPMIELAPDGELVAVRFNNRSAAPITDVPYDSMLEYYRAYRRLAELVDDPQMAVSLKLEPGDCLLMDNTRILHARTAYTGTGTRWLQGCYADRDGLLSTLAAIEQETTGDAS